MANPTIPHDCPYCFTTLAPFTLVNEHRPARHLDEINAWLVCQVCGRGAVWRVAPHGAGIDPSSYTLRDHYPNYPNNLHEIEFSPNPETPDTPDYLPSNVEQFFLEAVDNVKTGPNAAGAMLRKSVDVALKIVAPDATGTFYKRIEIAANDGKLTPELAEWAHHVRLEGNDATHDEDPFTREEAEQLHRFTELLLMYLFTLPGMLAERRKPDE